MGEQYSFSALPLDKFNMPNLNYAAAYPDSLNLSDSAPKTSSNILRGLQAPHTKWRIASRRPDSPIPQPCREATMPLSTEKFTGCPIVSPAKSGRLKSGPQPGQIHGKKQLNWSGRRDSNSRPPAPKAGALPDCATPRPSCRGRAGSPDPLSGPPSACRASGWRPEPRQEVDAPPLRVNGRRQRRAALPRRTSAPGDVNPPRKPTAPPAAAAAARDPGG